MASPVPVERGHALQGLYVHSQRVVGSLLRLELNAPNNAAAIYLAHRMIFVQATGIPFWAMNEKIRILLVASAN